MKASKSIASRKMYRAFTFNMMRKCVALTRFVSFIAFVILIHIDLKIAVLKCFSAFLFYHLVACRVRFRNLSFLNKCLNKDKFPQRQLILEINCILKQIFRISYENVEYLHYSSNNEILPEILYLNFSFF